MDGSDGREPGGGTVDRGFLVRGRVQGVGFRWATARAAERLGVEGAVRNREDGAVEVRVVGPAERVAEMAAWLRRGPPGARVDAVDEVAVALPLRSPGFRIER